jgi:integrase/recombinase XerD
VLAELQRLRYSPRSQTEFRRFYRRLLAFARVRDVREYSEDLGRQFLEEITHVRIGDLPQPLPTRFVLMLRYLNCLGDYQLHGALRRQKAMKAPYEPPETYRNVLEAFDRECDRRGYSPRSAETHSARLHAFVDYLAKQDVAPHAISSQDLSRYTATLIDYHPKTVAAVHTTIRTFLRFLYQAGYHARDLSGSVPRIRSWYYERVPPVWPADSVQRLLAAVDRGSPTGKRDYAILLLAARLGMRTADIRALTLSALQWDTKTITYAQQKTRRTVTYPLLDDVGWALIDYLKHGRPPTSSPNVFVRHLVPFEALGDSLHYIIARHARRAGIPNLPHGPHGMHSLRHTLASTLLEQHTPLPVIADIMGHLSMESTQVYLHVDIEGLRRCALNPDEVLAGAKAT